MSVRALKGIAVLGVFLLVSVVGCTPPVEEAVAQPKDVEEKTAVRPGVKTTVETAVTTEGAPVMEPAKPTALALKFRAGDIDRYKSVSLISKDYTYERPSAKEESKNEHSEVLREVTFAQEVTHVGEDGSAMAEIKIEGLRYFSQVSQEVKHDFDSSEMGSHSEPLYNLVGQKYTIRLYPDGTAKLVDAAKAKTAVREGTAGIIAERFFKDELVEARHSIPALLGRTQTPVMKGQQWSTVVNGPRGMLQVRQYNKVYGVIDTETKGGRPIVTVHMKAKDIKTVDKDGKSVDFFKDMFKGDSNYSGDGELIFDLERGKVLKSREKLEASWLATDPDYNEEGGPGPDVLMMGFSQSSSLEKMDYNPEKAD
jgi:hypothetical protein